MIALPLGGGQLRITFHLEIAGGTHQASHSILSVLVLRWSETLPLVDPRNLLREEPRKGLVSKKKQIQ